MSATWFVVDVEADGACPGLFSMVSFGAIRVDEKLETYFYGTTAPISDKFDPAALAVIGTTRVQHLGYADPVVTMRDFARWIEQSTPQGAHAVFISDNPAHDWQWINYYFHRFNDGMNPFGVSARRIGDLWSGLKRDAGAASTWKSLRKTAHTHNPVDDARGNAEALLAMRDKGLKLPLAPVA